MEISAAISAAVPDEGLYLHLSMVAEQG